jgi:hypothetical protein
MSDVTVMGHYHTWVRLSDGREFDVPDEIHVPTPWDVLCFLTVDAGHQPPSLWRGRTYERKGEH